LLGATLLTRARNGAGISRTAVTAEGAALLEAVESAFAQLGAACDTVRERARRTRPVLAISASHSVASLWLAPLLAAFAALHPSVQWKVHATEDVPDMLREGIDLAVLRARPGVLAVGDSLLFSETVFPVCSPSLGLGGRPDELLRHNLLEEDHGTSTEKGWATWLDLLGRGSWRAGDDRAVQHLPRGDRGGDRRGGDRPGAAAADRFRAGEQPAGATLRRPLAAGIVGHDHPPPSRCRARRARRATAEFPAAVAWLRRKRGLVQVPYRSRSGKFRGQRTQARIGEPEAGSRLARRMPQ
jgi:DNA-binding transcriptional LysR family regulator